MAQKKQMYVLLRDNRLEQGVVRERGWVTDLARYDKEQIARLIADGVFKEAPGDAPAAKEE